MILAEMTSPEVDALPRDIVVLMPVASCEQHSLHLPVFTDSLIGGEVARRVHERCRDDVLVLPVQWLGYSQHHIRYPGTVSAVSQTHLLLMMDIVASMVGHGFRKILIQNSHGGNGANISVLLQRLMERYPRRQRGILLALGVGIRRFAEQDTQTRFRRVRPCRRIGNVDDPGDPSRTRAHGPAGCGWRTGRYAGAGGGLLFPFRSTHPPRRRGRPHGRMRGGWGAYAGCFRG